MKKEAFELVKKEMQYVALLFLVLLIAFKIAFFRENLVVILRTVFAMFWMFILPGYFIMLYWQDKLGFMERLIIGIALSAATIGAFSYYLGLIGLHIKYHAFVLPVLLILIGIIFSFRK